MQNRLDRCLVPLLAAAVAVAYVAATPAAQTSPYAGEETRAIKALSAQEVESLLGGKGMGFAKAAELNGYPLKITELLAQLEGTCYVTRQSVQNPAAVRKTKAAIRKAFENSMMKKGTSFVEVVGTCNSGWKVSPVEANKWMEENMFPFYPLGDMKDR